MNIGKNIAIFATTVVIIALAVWVYLGQLSATVADNLMTSMDEISRHDVETIEGSLSDSYARLSSVGERLHVYDVETIYEAQEQLNLEAASSALFNAIYLLSDTGDLYSSSYVRLDADQHLYDELFAEGRDQFVMLYEEENGKLETTKESLVYGIRIPEMTLDDVRFIALVGRTDLSSIRDQLLIESFGGEGVSSVVNAQGYYVVGASAATDLAGRNNFYDMLESGTIEGGVTVEDVRQNIAEGRSFVVNCTTAAGERLVLSFAPVEGTSWSFIMAVPMDVFDHRFAPFITMTAIMLVVVVVVLVGMMLVLFRFMKQSVQARAEASARTEFLSNMSHEIRTPLNGIIGLNHLMERHLDDREAMESYVHKLGRSVQYLLSLVNDILDVSKLQAGKVELMSAPFDLTAALENVCDMQRDPMEQKGINFELVEDIPQPHLIGDEVRISQVLMNILSNAVKFTPEDGTIAIEARQQFAPGQNRVLCEISIADTGCGMTPEFQKRIFETFSQERHTTSESQKGTGLGMAISHLLTEQMGGTLTVESEVGKGSCFRVAIPLPVDPKAPATAVLEAASVAGGADATLVAESKEAAACNDAPIAILVAEDNELNTEIIVSILSEEGYEVSTAENGQEAIEVFDQSPVGHFSAILMDAQMPVMDGYESARAIRKLHRSDAETVMIYACTASTFAEDRARALDAGMNDFLAKPLNVPIMLQKLESLRKGESHDQR
ncbi:MAG: response regulator [Eggerthellaceae bacterium]|nr:response regulator [Eggerthellaceae bacterium]